MSKSSHKRKINGKIYEQWIKIGNTVDKKTIDELIDKDRERGFSVVSVKPTVDEMKWENQINISTIGESNMPAKNQYCDKCGGHFTKSGSVRRLDTCGRQRCLSLQRVLEERDEVARDEE